MMLFFKLFYVVVFDIVFYQSLLEYVYCYVLLEVFYCEYGVCCYGFYGISYCYVSYCVVEMVGLVVGDSSWFSVYFGNGSLICVIVNGQSFDISMGLILLEGLVMGICSGDVDFNLYSYLVWILGWSLECIDLMLNNESGLFGFFDLFNDMCILEQECEQGYFGVVLVIEVFCYCLVKFLVVMSCVLL